MGLSHNEIEAMGKRAARGAGLSWGIAEEAGKAVRWLTARGYPGVAQLADLLTRNDGQNYTELAPVEIDGVWRAPAGCLCPLIAGATLSDRAAEIAGGRVILLGETAQPLLLAPYAAGAAKLTGTALEIAWDDVTMIVASDGEMVEGHRETLTTRRTHGVRCRRVDRIDALTAPAPPVNELAVPVNELAAPDVAAVPAEAWDRLAALARRTFAPATEASRLSGAGAGPGGDG